VTAARQAHPTAPSAELVADLLPTLRAFAIPMPVKFRGTTMRQGALLSGPAGWAEFSPFPEYGPRECARWLACALEAAVFGWPAPLRESVPVNVTGTRDRRRVELPDGEGQGRRAGPAR
jgi:o-succinylbenzoate synthase